MEISIIRGWVCSRGSLKVAQKFIDECVRELNRREKPALNKLSKEY